MNKLDVVPVRFLMALFTLGSKQTLVGIVVAVALVTGGRCLLVMVVLMTISATDLSMAKK